MELVYGLDLIVAEDWRNLRPNYLGVDNIHPSDLTTSDVSSITDAILEVDPSRIFRDKRHIGIIETNAGDLEVIGAGESKVVFKFSQGDKSIAVLLESGFNLTSQVPQDPRIYPGYSQQLFTGKKQYWFYSDARTYLSLRLPQSDIFTYGLHFQEYLGENSPNSGVAIAADLMGSRRKKKQEVVEYIQARGFDIVEPGDFTKLEHYFFPDSKPTKPAVVDILLVRD